MQYAGEACLARTKMREGMRERERMNKRGDGGMGEINGEKRCKWGGRREFEGFFVFRENPRCLLGKVLIL